MLAVISLSLRFFAVVKCRRRTASLQKRVAAARLGTPSSSPAVIVIATAHHGGLDCPKVGVVSRT